MSYNAWCRKKYRCEYPSCKNAYFAKDPKNKKFHRFPKNPEMRKMWKIACSMDPNSKKDTMVLCEDHFSDSDYNNQEKLRLKFNAIPKPYPRQTDLSTLIPQSPDGISISGQFNNIGIKTENSTGRDKEENTMGDIIDSQSNNNESESNLEENQKTLKLVILPGIIYKRINKKQQKNKTSKKTTNSSFKIFNSNSTTQPNLSMNMDFCINLDPIKELPKDLCKTIGIEAVKAMKEEKNESEKSLKSQRTQNEADLSSKQSRKRSKSVMQPLITRSIKIPEKKIKPNEEIKLENLENTEENFTQNTEESFSQLNEFIRLKPTMSDNLKTFNVNNKEIKMAVMLESYPLKELTEEQGKVIQKAILQRIRDCKSSKGPKFTNSYFKDGVVYIICADESSKDWLLAMIKGFKPWYNCMLRIKKVIEDTGLIKVGVWIPKTDLIKVDDHRGLMQLIEKQNSGLNVESWEVLLTEEEEDGTNLIVYIDGDSFDTLQRVGFKVYLGFHQLTFKVLDSVPFFK